MDIHIDSVFRILVIAFSDHVRYLILQNQVLLDMAIIHLWIIANK